MPQVPPAPSQAPAAPDPLRHLYAHWARNCASSVEWLLSDTYPQWFLSRGLTVLPMHTRIQRANKYRAAAAYWQAKHIEANPTPVEPTA